MTSDRGMHGAMTLEEAVEAPCPVGRTFVEAHATCILHACPLFRRMPRVCDHAWQEAVKRHAAEIDDKTPGRSKAAAAVTADPAAFGLVDRFYCGMGGRPEA